LGAQSLNCHQNDPKSGTTSLQGKGGKEEEGWKVDIKSIDLGDFDVKVNPERGSLLLVRKGFAGLPDEVIEGKGLTIEKKDGEVVIIDIFRPDLVFSSLITEEVA
jgi:metal-dependent hydrolase (beta-lactamase superfamily II)